MIVYLGFVSPVLIRLVTLSPALSRSLLTLSYTLLHSLTQVQHVDHCAEMDALKKENELLKDKVQRSGERCHDLAERLKNKTERDSPNNNHHHGHHDHHGHHGHHDHHIPGAGGVGGGAWWWYGGGGGGS